MLDVKTESCHAVSYEWRWLRSRFHFPENCKSNSKIDGAADSSLPFCCFDFSADPSISMAATLNNTACRPT